MIAYLQAVLFCFAPVMDNITPGQKNILEPMKKAHLPYHICIFRALTGTAELLVTKRKIKALGLDTPSIDYGQSKDFKTHQTLLGKNIPAFENVANLDQLPAKGAYVVALPMKKEVRVLRCGLLRE